MTNTRLPLLLHKDKTIHPSIPPDMQTRDQREHKEPPEKEMQHGNLQHKNLPQNLMPRHPSSLPL